MSVDWPRPFDVLRGKWHEIPLAVERRSTVELRTLSDGALFTLWEQNLAAAYEDFGRRAWRHTLYAEAFRGKRLLDVGSGFGFDAVTFARAGARVTCLDIHEANLELIGRLARTAGVDVPTVYLEDLSSLDDLPMFDVIWCNGSLISLPFATARRECAALLDHLERGGRWIELCYPYARWEREGSMPFETWGSRTDGGAPWMEWYDLDKLLARLAPARFDVVLAFEYHNSDFNWFDLLFRG